jgi:hypothetical protein
MVQQIGSVAANHARISMASDDSYNSFLRTKVEDKFYYLRGINTTDEFDELVDAELRRMSTTSIKQPTNLKMFVERVKEKIVAKMAKFIPRLATT